MRPLVPRREEELRPEVRPVRPPERLPVLLRPERPPLLPPRLEEPLRDEEPRDEDLRPELPPPREELPLRADPPFLPPPSCLLTVAQARRSASSPETPRSSYPSSMCCALRRCLLV